MYTKSIIQQTAENLKLKDNFRTALENLMEKYNIEDSVFIYKNGSLYEAVEGYFNVDSVYDSLTKAVSESDVNTMGIRIMNNKVFQTGKLYKTLSECSEDSQVLDLYCLTAVR
jgi:adenine-specific DNA methylase